MLVDPFSKLRHLLQVIGFSLAIATIQYAFAPDRPYAPPVAYSLCIGIIIWAIIDLGRHLFPSAAETGWPEGLAGVALVAGGITGGYLLGHAIADLGCRTFGWYDGRPPMDRATELRNSILITVIAGLTGSYYFYNMNRSVWLERRMAEIRRQADEARLKLLEAQLEPHMLFNTLANLRVLIGIDPARAQTMLDHLNDYLRATLAASRATHHPLSQEFDRLDDYLSLMAVRMGPRLAYSLDLPDSLRAQAVPTLLLQPLVENAIRHGLEPRVEGGRIQVSARADGDALWLEVADTGIGFDAEGAPPPADGHGFGLAQVRERLSTAYGDAAALEVRSRPGEGTTLRLRLPLAGAPA